MPLARGWTCKRRFAWAGLGTIPPGLGTVPASFHLGCCVPRPGSVSRRAGQPNIPLAVRHEGRSDVSRVSRLRRDLLGLEGQPRTFTWHLDNGDQEEDQRDGGNPPPISPSESLRATRDQGKRVRRPAPAQPVSSRAILSSWRRTGRSPNLLHRSVDAS
jgi:hypothetical protein